MSASIVDVAVSKDRVAFVMIPGSFSGPWLYLKVIALLTSAPYSYPSSSMHAMPLLSATPSRPEGPATMYDDASTITSRLNALADECKDIVLVMSSYGGSPGTEAAYGLSKASRTKKGLHGGIVSLLYIAAHMPLVGQCINDFAEGPPPKGDDYMSVEYSAEAAQAVFNDLQDPEEQKRYFNMMRDHSRITFEGTLKHEAWREVKSYYLHSKKDNIIRPDVQRRIVDSARKQGADVEVVEIDAGHVPMLGREIEVCDLLAKAAGF